MAMATWTFSLQKWPSGRNRDPILIILLQNHLFIMEMGMDTSTKHPFKKDWIFMKLESPTSMETEIWTSYPSLTTGEPHALISGFKMARESRSRHQEFRCK